jgi:hypothetical protein
MDIIEREEFDLGTGLPMSWVKHDVTWWEWSQEWLSLKWPQWAGHSRRSAVESLVAIAPTDGAQRGAASVQRSGHVAAGASIPPGFQGR